VTPARSFARLWLLFTLLTLAYAVGDLALNPWLRFEGGFSMKPDFSRLPDLMHWGGRLYINGAWYLLVCNAVFIGGMVALAALTVLAVYRVVRRRTPEVERPSVRVSQSA